MAAQCAWRADLVRLIFIAALGVQSCVPSPPGAGHSRDVPSILPSAHRVLRGCSHAVWARVLPVAMPCRLRGGANIPFRQGSTIEKEKQAASEVEAARCVQGSWRSSAHALSIVCSHFAASETFAAAFA